MFHYKSGINHANNIEVFSPSRLTTRGGDQETIVDSSAGISLDPQERTLPTTSASINTVDPISRPITNARASDSYTIPQTTNYPLSSIFEKFNTSNQSSSLTVRQRIGKLVKIEKRLIKQHSLLIKEIGSWCNVLPNDESKKLLFHFIKLLEMETEVQDQFIKKQEYINVQLQNVNKREKRTNDLKLKRNKMLIRLRDNENKVGDSPITTLTKENLEELDCSVDIVEDQLIRSINNGLKNSLVDYVLSLQSASLRFKENSKIFFNHYNYSNLNVGDITSSQGLQKLILQNRLNNYSNDVEVSTDLSRDVSSALSSSKNYNYRKYIALSPNEIGKVLENRYKGENSNESGATIPATSNGRQFHGSSSADPTTIQIEKSDYQHQIHQQQSLNNTVGPPPTSNTNPQDHTTQKIEEGFNYNSFISHYSTPGGLGGRPSTGQNLSSGTVHPEWN